MEKMNFDYFDAFIKQAEYMQETALNFQSALTAGELGTAGLMNALHTVENDADQVNHAIQSHLIDDFVVPMERDGMNALAHALDDVVDAIEDLAIMAYCYHCNSFEAEGPVMVAMMTQACDELKDAVYLLKDFNRKPAEIEEHLIKVQTFESECDRVYIESVHNLYGNENIDSEQRRIAHAMFDALEDAMDAVENAAERVESMVAENM